MIILKGGVNMKICSIIFVKYNDEGYDEYPIGWVHNDNIPLISKSLQQLIPDIKLSTMDTRNDCYKTQYPNLYVRLIEQEHSFTTHNMYFICKIMGKRQHLMFIQNESIFQKWVKMKKINLTHRCDSLSNDEYIVYVKEEIS